MGDTNGRTAKLNDYIKYDNCDHLPLPDLYTDQLHVGNRCNMDYTGTLATGIEVQIKRTPFFQIHVYISSAVHSGTMELQSITNTTGYCPLLWLMTK